MLTSLHIRNFKAWGDTGAIRLAPLTVIFGANSAGKSSLGQLLLALKQTVLSSDRRRALHLGDAGTLIDLGSFAEVVHLHDLGQPLRFELGWRLAAPLTVHDPVTAAEFVGDELRLAVTLLADRNEQPVVHELRYRMLRDGETMLTVEYARAADGGYRLTAAPLALRPVAAGEDPALPPPDKFYRVPDQARARFRNADFLADLAYATEAVLGGLHHLGPLREPPRRLYAWTGEAPENVGPRGEFAIPALLAASEQARSFDTGAESYRFDAYIAYWLQRLELIHGFAVRPIAKGRREYEVLIRTHPAGGEVKLTDVGFGVSQLLPALVQAFYGPPGSTVWLEQPEVHLHPRVQAELADAFIAAVQARENGSPRHAQLVVESHSEHFLNRIQRRVAEGTLAAEDVAVYFCRRGEAQAEMEPLRLNEYGEIENWPENFFGDEMADIAARTLAAVRRRQQAGKTSQP